MSSWFNVETGACDLYESSTVPMAHHPEHSAGPAHASVEWTNVMDGPCDEAGKSVQAALSALPGPSGFLLSS